MFVRGALLLWLSVTVAMMVTASKPRCIMYLTGQHVVVPQRSLVGEITHVMLAFMRSETFLTGHTTSDWPLFTTVGKARQHFAPETQILVAIGGWGDSEGFEGAARDHVSRMQWAANVKVMVDETGADGVDIDWEYPGGNRDDYKEVPNERRVWEIEAFVQLLAALRSILGPNKTISVATPGKEEDLMAFTHNTVPRILESVNFISVMTYDLMNRRDTMVKHHSGVNDSRASLQRYIDRGAPPDRLNLGLGYYAKWFMTQMCDPNNVLSCPTQLLENPSTGADLGRTAGFSWHDSVPRDLASSFRRARSEGRYFADGSYGFWDAEEKRWWSFDTPRSIGTKMDLLVEGMGLGGVFAWGLGEDAPAFEHFKKTIEKIAGMGRRRALGETLGWSKDEL